MTVAERFKEAIKSGELDEYEEVIHLFTLKDKLSENLELLKDPMDEFYKKAEGKEIWDGFIDCVDLYPEGNKYEYQLVGWVK